jgi:hypothetical protein
VRNSILLTEQRIMDIWQTRTSIARVGWDNYLDVELFANADNSFSLGTAAQALGSTNSFFDMFAANIDAFGFAPLGALQRFENPGFLPNGNPTIYRVGTYAHQSTNSSGVVRLTGSYAMQKLSQTARVTSKRLLRNLQVICNNSCSQTKGRQFIQRPMI